MADQTVSYRAKSVFASKTLWFNLIAAVVAFLGGDQLKSILGANYPTWLVTIIAAINMVLRLVTVRPVSFMVPPGETTPVPVEKLK